MKYTIICTGPYLNSGTCVISFPVLCHFIELEGPFKRLHLNHEITVDIYGGSAKYPLALHTPLKTNTDQTTFTKLGYM